MSEGLEHQVSSDVWTMKTTTPGVLSPSGSIETSFLNPMSTGKRLQPQSATRTPMMSTTMILASLRCRVPRYADLGRSAFWRLAIVAVLVVIIVSATVAGSLIAQKQHTASSIKLDFLHFASEHKSYYTYRNPIALSTTNASSSNSTAATPSPPLASPTSDCSSLSTSTNGITSSKTMDLR